MKNIWTQKDCECDCGMIYCLECERPCDHDRLCPDCNGYVVRPYKIQSWIDAMVFKDEPKFRTRRECMQNIEEIYG